MEHPTPYIFRGPLTFSRIRFERRSKTTDYPNKSEVDCLDRIMSVIMSMQASNSPLTDMMLT